MANPRRSWSSFSNNNNHQISSEQNSCNRSTTTSSSMLLVSNLIIFLKKPHAFPFLLCIFLFLTWVSLRLQHTSHFSSFSSSSSSHHHPQSQSQSHDDDKKANLFRFSSSFPSQISKDKRGWILDPLSLALDSPISGGAVSCTSVHLGEIRPGGVRGNHRHFTCNETFIIWGATTKFRLENSDVVDKGYAEVVVGADEVAVAASPSGTAHALVNLDPIRISYFMGCQDSIIDYNSSTTDFNVWKDL